MHIDLFLVNGVENAPIKPGVLKYDAYVEWPGKF